MNTEKIKILNDITQNKSNRLRESYLKKNYINIYNDIQSYCSNIPDLPFIQKIWHWTNDMNSYFLCKCGKKTSFNRNWIEGYRKNCSAKCSQSENDVKEKRKKTTIEKYGVDNIAKIESIKIKTEKTNIEKYGYKSSFQNIDVKNKWRKTIIEKYGTDHYFKTDEFKIKTKKYYLEKYGVEHQLDIEYVKQRIKETCIRKYGVNTYLNTDHSRSCIKKYNRSSYEDEIINWIKSMGIYVESSSRIISPMIIDIYLPDNKIAIEFNGLYWHSEIFKDKNYHIEKTKRCDNIGISLIHIWEDDWINRKEILKSIISNKIGIIKNKIFARKCIIKEVNNDITSRFLNDNHIQGYTKFSDSIGLYYNDELVSLMCFGWRSTNGKKEYELIRFCNKLNVSVIGSASKIFKFFITKSNIEDITSYSDISIFNGNLYRKLGFKFIQRSAVNYWWVVNGIRRHRFNYNKKKLVKNGYDPLKTEVEIMHEIGNYRIFGCGQDKWIWHKNKT